MNFYFWLFIFATNNAKNKLLPNVIVLQNSVNKECFMQVLKIDPIALRTAKTPRNFDSSECTRVNISDLFVCPQVYCECDDHIRFCHHGG